MADSSFRINRGITLNPQTGAPGSPTNGDLYFDSTMGTYSFYQNGFWINLTSKADVASATDLTSAQFTAAVVQNPFVRVTGTTATNVHGLVASTSAKQILLYNQTNTTVIIKNASITEGTAANRIITPTGGDMTLTSGQTMLLVYDDGQSRWVTASSPGSGSGSGTGDDLNALLFRASFNDGFDETPTGATSAVDVSANMTDPTTYSAAKTLYQLNYDASKTIAGGTTTTNIELSAVAAFTVKIGDIVVYGSEARRITAVASQSSFTTEAFSVAPTVAGQVTVSQVVYTKDIYNLDVDGNSIADAFGALTFSEIMVDYEDTSTVDDNIFDINVAPVIAYAASHNGTSFTNVQSRPTSELTTVTSISLPGAGTALYLRFFAFKTSGSGSVNVLRYKAYMQKDLQVSSGGVTWSAYATTDSSTTPVNCSISLTGGKTTITLTGGLTYAMGVNPTTTYGSLDIYLNGQLLPRFLASTTPASDAHFTEVSPTVIQLDTDYSSVQLDIQVIQRTSNLPIDTTTANTTNITAINTHLFRNYIINGNLDIWQRNTSFSSPANGVYTSDRWKTAWDGTSGTYTVSRQAFTIGQTDVPNEPSYFLRWDQTVAGSGGSYRGPLQPIESVKTLAGKTVTVSFWAKADASRTITPALTQYFGTGGSPSSDVLHLGATCSVTTTWQKFVRTIALSSISGKTLGSNNNHSLNLLLSIPANTVCQVDFAQIMVNEGGQAAPWVYASGGSGLMFGAELALCQRYFEKTYELDVAPGTTSTSGTAIQSITSNSGEADSWWAFKVSKRSSVPVISIYSPVTGTLDRADSGGDVVVSEGSSKSHWGWTLNSGGVFGASANYLFHFTAEAEL